jgi:hypothetical protein
MEVKLCQPASIILLVSIAGILYHILVGDFLGVLYWASVAILGTGVFQALCYIGFEPLAWIFMAIPVLLVCFFLAVALFASSMRINNVRKVPCSQCHKHDCGGGCKPKKKPHCNKTRCDHCNGCGCNRCIPQNACSRLEDGRNN